MRAVGQLRHPLGRNKRRGLDELEAGIGQSVDQLDLDLGGNHLLLVLQSVTRTDIDDPDASGECGHGGARKMVNSYYARFGRQLKSVASREAWTTRINNLAADRHIPRVA